MVQQQIRANSHDILRTTTMHIVSPLILLLSQLTLEGRTHLQRSHDTIDLLLIQTQHAVQNRNLIIPQRFLALTMELQERLELGFFVVIPAVVGA